MKNMAKLAMISMMLIVMIGGAEVYAAPVISFVEPPTPADGATIGVDWAEIEVFIQDEGLRDVIFNWDGTDHYIYDDSLVLMFNFDNVAALGENYAGVGDVVKDLSGVGNDGYLSNEALDPDMVPAWISTGRYGGAFDFTGNGVDSGQSIRVPHSESLNPYGGEGDFAIAFWILTRDDYDGDVIRKGSTETGDGRWYKVEHAGGSDIDALSLNFNTDGTDATVTSTEVYNDNQWHHVVAQRRSGQAELWIDGALDGTAPISGSIYNDADLAIGSKDTQNDDFLNSALDEIRIYNRSFNQVEITELYYSNLSKYDFEEWLLYVNQSNLAEGTYTYQAFAADSSLMSQTEQRSVTIAQGQKPTVSLEEPGDGSIVNTTDVVFSCSATDGIGLLDASLYVGEEPQIVTFSGPSDTEDAQLYATDDSSTPEVEGPDTNAGDAVNINIDGANPHAHGVIKFLNVFGSGPGQVPPGSAITFATLEINCSNAGNVMKLYRLNEDWVEGEVTWNDRSSGTPWLDAGADGPGSNAGVSIDGDCSITGVKTIDITQFVQEWSDGAANFGVVITDTGTDGVDFDSSESGNPPVLTVSFGQSGLQLIETVPMSGTSDSVSFSPVTLSDQQNHVWNCLVRNTLLLESWVPADFTLTVDTQYPDEPVLVAPADGASDVPIPVTLEVTVSDPQADLLDVTFFGRGSAADESTIIVLPDTQKYVLNGAYPEIFTAQTQWIIDNKDALNIVFVTHEGDIVDTWNNTTEWDYANNSMSLLDGVVPYGVVPGDHDHEGENPDGSTQYYESYFPASRFETYPWWGGDYNNNTNNYQLMTIGGQDYIFFGLDFCPSQDELDWANGILTTYSERRAILTTHALLDVGAQYYGSSDFSRYPNGDPNPTGDTSFIWNDLIRNHENLQLVLCGHMHGEARRTDNNLAGKPVHQLLANYQGRPNGGNGWLRIMRFVPAESKVYVETYSPWLDQYETDGDSQFTLDFPMDWFTEIGTNTGVASGTSTSVVWPGLSALTEYEWFVGVTDPTTRTSVGPVWSFTTEPPDAEPPVIDDATGDTSGTTGESVTIQATITDNTNVAGAMVYYTPIDGTETTVSMTEGALDLWSADVPAASGKVGAITYYIIAEDDFANTATDPPSGTYNITVTDNDIPTISGATGDTSADTDETVLISATITDNIDVVGATLHYTPVGGSETSAPMVEGAGDLWSVSIPAGSQEGTIPYYITADDAAANTVTDPPSGSYIITVTLPDIEAPVITGATGNTSGTTGESVTISATITDNVAVTSATVHYTPIDGSETAAPMTEGANWSADVPVASDKVGTITYYITAQDEAANPAREPSSGTYDIAVTDNDAPSAVGDLAATAVAGGTIDLAWSAATDNINVASYNIYREATEITDLTGLTALATGIAGPPYTDSTAADGTTYYYAVAALDGAANKAAVSNSPSATSDGSGPAISGAASSNVTGSEATITWTTDEAGDSVVVYGTATPPGSQQSDAAMVTAHSVSLTGLSAATTYYYEVKSTDAIGNTSTDNDGGAYYTFTTETLPNTLFTDGFESGSFAAGGWQTTGDASVREPAAYTGLYGVQLKKAASIVKTVSTVGYSAIHVKYARKTKSFDTGEWLFVEWSTNGSTWNLLEQTQDVSWASRDIACGTGADNQSTFMLRFSTNTNNSSETGFVDDVEIIGTPSGPDNDAPSPDPMTWAAVPQATGSVSISMTATTATDVSGVEYYFACTAGGGNDSGWQDSPTYEDTGLLPDTQYTYQAKARDKSANQNETAFSSAASATTLPDDTTPPSPNPATWATLPYATGATSIAMAATTATDISGVEYYFACTAGGGHDSDWQDSTSYEDTGLSPDTTYTYTVTARDKSVNQNSTGASSAESATTLPQSGDVVTITKAEYKPARSELNVEATSSEGGTAVLTVEGYGEMTYDSRKNIYKLKIRPVGDPGGTVTVTSSEGGSDTSPVTYK